MSSRSPTEPLPTPFLFSVGYPSQTPLCYPEGVSRTVEGLSTNGEGVQTWTTERVPRWKDRVSRVVVKDIPEELLLVFPLWRPIRVWSRTDPHRTYCTDRTTYTSPAHVRRPISPCQGLWSVGPPKSLDDKGSRRYTNGRPRVTGVDILPLWWWERYLQFVKLCHRP